MQERGEAFVPKSKDELRSMIGESIVDNWQGNFKGLDNLWTELIKGDSQLVWESIDGKRRLVRNVNVAVIYVYYQHPEQGLMQLKEDRQEYIDDKGEKRVRRREKMKYVAGKITTAQTPLQGAITEINEEIFQDRQIIGGDRLNLVAEENEGLSDSDSFPGLACRYTTYKYQVVLTDVEYQEEYREINGTKTNYFLWISAENQLALD